MLLAKKRYVGYKYEAVDSAVEFEAKGIETIRRDGCLCALANVAGPAVQKILENSLKILFRTQDLSQIKEYLLEEWTRILSGRVSLKDFLIATEVKLGHYRYLSV